MTNGGSLSSGPGTGGLNVAAPEGFSSAGKPESGGRGSKKFGSLFFLSVLVVVLVFLVFLFFYGRGGGVVYSTTSTSMLPLTTTTLQFSILDCRHYDCFYHIMPAGVEPVVCEDFTVLRDACYYAASVKNADGGFAGLYCSRIRNDSLLSECLFSAAVSSLDGKICEGIADASKRGDCVDVVKIIREAIGGGNPSVCTTSRVNVSSVLRSVCAERVVRRDFGKVSLCGTLDCVRRFRGSFESGDCAGLLAEGLRDECYFTFVFRNGSSPAKGVCASIVGQKSRMKCAFHGVDQRTLNAVRSTLELAVMEESPEKCGETSIELFTEYCVSVVNLSKRAFEAGNSTICVREAPDDMAVQLCVRKVRQSG